MRPHSSFSPFLALLVASLALAVSGAAQNPVPPLRQPAEFEPMQGVMIRYPLGIPVALVAEMAEDLEVVTVLLDGPGETPGIPIRARIHAYSNAVLTGGTPEVRYRTGGSWSSVAMNPIGGGEYLAYLPAQPVGTTVEYTIHAEDASGRKENHPYIGEIGAHQFTVQPLGSDISAISAANGGVVEFQLDAGVANAGRSYYLLASRSGTAPGMSLPGGLVLPLNPDAFMGHARRNANTPQFSGFVGTLDASGRATARLDLDALPSLQGATLDFAFLCSGPFDFVSNPTGVSVLE
jgi:hypothetical protein